MYQHTNVLRPDQIESLARIDADTRTPADIKEKRRAYTLRSWTLYIRSSHFSGSFNFETAGAALDHLYHLVDRWKRIVATREYGSSWAGFDTWATELTCPDGMKIRARDILLLESFSTSDR